MKTNLLLLILWVLGALTATAQSTNSHSCLHPDQWLKIQKAISESQLKYGLPEKSMAKIAAGTYSWPLRYPSDPTDTLYYEISAYMDHNTSTGISDYRGGNRTYDGHRGTDIALENYAWHMMRMNQVEVVAARAGILITKDDSHPDNHCDTNSRPGNEIVIRHSDGTFAIYAHIRTNSATKKCIGETIAAGEYLGIVGSSGKSTGPHLHFELLDAAKNNVDPFAPPDGGTLWDKVPSYRRRGGNKMFLSCGPPLIPICPGTEELKRKTRFCPGESMTINLSFWDVVAGDKVIIKVFGFTPPTTNYIRDLTTITLSMQDSIENHWYTFTPHANDNRIDILYRGTVHRIMIPWGEPDVPTIIASAKTNLCAGESVRLMTAVDCGITWSNGATTPYIDVSTPGCLYCNRNQWLWHKNFSTHNG